MSIQHFGYKLRLLKVPNQIQVPGNLLIHDYNNATGNLGSPGFTSSQQIHAEHHGNTCWCLGFWVITKPFSYSYSNTDAHYHQTLNL